MRPTLLSAVLALALSLPLAAQEPAGSAAPEAAVAVDPAAGFRDDLARDYSGAVGRLVQLAEAVPADKYGWRPAPGVRSFSEVLMHVAAGNFIAAASLGVPVPPVVDPMKLASITDKEEALRLLHGSIEQFKAALAALDPATLDGQVELFGDQTSRRRLMLLMQGHAHEHTGQAIAYARMSGVTPPWSRAGSGE
jgi:uncharacterized damage-inducible protein DinB